MFRRRAVTVLEILIGMLILVLVLALIWGFVRQAGRIGQKVETVHAAVVHAELAMGAVAADLRSMLAPDPTRQVAPYKVGASGRSLAFFRVEEVRGELRARPVMYEARATAAGNFQLYRDGQRIGAVLLGDFRVEELKLEGSGTISGQPVVLPRSLGVNPRLRVTVEGASADRPRAAQAADAFHRLSQIFAVPETSPAATLDLPPVARDLARRAVRVDGALPDPP